MTNEEHQKLSEIHAAMKGLTVMVGEMDLTEVNSDQIYFLYMAFIDKIAALLLLDIHPELRATLPEGLTDEQHPDLQNKINPTC